ncbi:MAG: class I SAM-dependent methyltransferase [Gemmatimonadales bacterium]
MSDSLERIVPHELVKGETTGEETLRLHVERYRFASSHVKGGIVLDLACGVGYGSAMLADTPRVRRVIAADRSATALALARTFYTHPKVELVRADGASPFRSKTFDAVVSLETLEHIADPAAFFRALVDLVAPDGVLIASVPVTPSVDANPHHRSDFTDRAFLGMGEAHHLEMLDALRQIQPYSPLAAVLRKERRTKDLRQGLLRYYGRHPSALFRRLASLMRYGFTNRYLTIAWRRPGTSAAGAPSAHE